VQHGIIADGSDTVGLSRQVPRSYSIGSMSPVQRYFLLQGASGNQCMLQEARQVCGTGGPVPVIILDSIAELHQCQWRSRIFALFLLISCHG